MQSVEAAKLRKEWKEKGSPPCSHPHMEKERNESGLTGDKICTTCGHEEWIVRKPVSVDGWAHDCSECNAKGSMILNMDDGLHHCCICHHKQKFEDFKMPF
ncbi:hypothetical protein [Bacillus sp. F9_6S_D1_P_5]